MINEPLIGTPRQPVSEWLEQYARDNEVAQRDALMPWNRLKHKGQAWAFRTAAELVRRAHSEGGKARRSLSDEKVQ